MILFSDRGTPDGYFQEHGYSGHTHKWLKDDGSFVYVQVHVRADKGFKTLNNQKAGELAGSNPDYGTQTLFEAIESGNFPSWTVYIVCDCRLCWWLFLTLCVLANHDSGAG
jgi:catalase